MNKEVFLSKVRKCSKLTFNTKLTLFICDALDALDKPLCTGSHQ